MNRRAFLRMIAGTAAATAAPTYFLPPIGGWKSDVIAHAPGLYWDHHTPAQIMTDLNAMLAHIYGIRRAPGEKDADLLRRLEVAASARWMLHSDSSHGLGVV